VVNIYLILFGIYLVFMAIVGVYSGRKVAVSYEEYAVSGRRMPLRYLVATYAATGMGAGFTIGTAQKAAFLGLGAAMYPTGESGASLITSLLAKPVHKISQKLKLYTVPQLLENAYGVEVRTFCAIITAICLSIIAGGQLIGGSSIISAITGLDINASLWIAAAIVLFYTVYGGLWAVVYTDFIQSIVVYIGLLVTLPFALKAAGGWSNVVATISATSPSLLKLASGAVLGFFFVSFLSSTFNAWSDQIEFQRIFAAKDGETARRALIARAFVQAPTGWISAILGLCALVILGANTEPALLLPNLIKVVLPPAVGAVFIVGLMGAVMSTADSALIAGSTVLIQDIYRRFINPTVSDEHTLKVGRLITLILGIFSVILCFYLPGIVDAIILAFSIKGAAFAFPTIMAIFKPGFLNKHGALWGSVLAAATVIGWQLAGSPLGVDPLYPGLLVSFALSLLITKLTASKEKAKV